MAEMTEQQLTEIEQRWEGKATHRCPECNARPHRESDVIDLIAEVRRLNRMVEAACLTIVNVIRSHYPADSVLCPFCLDLIRDCFDNCNDQFNDCWRKYLESEVADK